MSTPPASGSSSSKMPSLTRALRIADDPADDDDRRLRKRVGVVAGYLTIVAPFTLPIQTQGHPWSWPLAIALSVCSVANLFALARSHRFDRYVITLIGAGTVFVPLATAVGGGITGSSAGLVWAFLIPAYALMALGPARATPWFVAFLLVIGLMLVSDPLVHETIGSPPYPLRLFGQAQNIVIPLTITFLLLRYTDLRRRDAEARVDELLTNAIPASIAARLRAGDDDIADRYEQATVLFADLAGFTSWTARTEPMRAVRLLDDLFTEFDELAVQHGLEKVRTIGDSFMAVSGAPDPRPDHAEAAMRMAIAILDATAAWRRANGLELGVRVGVASGPLIGGVIGRRRMLFDVWGDTVNVASRMESSGLPGRVQVSSTTWEAVRGAYGFEPRDLEVKGMGPMTAYLLQLPG